MKWIVTSMGRNDKSCSVQICFVLTYNINHLFFFFLNNCSTFQCILIVQKGLMNTAEIPQHTHKSLGAMHQWFLENRWFSFSCFVQIYIVFLLFDFRISLFIVMYSSPVLGYISLILPLISTSWPVEGGSAGICDRSCVCVPDTHTALMISKVSRKQ